MIGAKLIGVVRLIGGWPKTNGGKLISGGILISGITNGGNGGIGGKLKFEIEIWGGAVNDMHGPPSVLLGIIAPLYKLNYIIYYELF